MQPETAADGDDRGSIIEAAYTCLSEPHSGAIPVAAILQRAGVSTRAFYRHFESKDELFLAMLREETDALAERLDRICADVPGGPADQLKAWISDMFGLIHDDRTRMHFTVIDSDEVRAAKGYRETREQAHADRERSLVAILRRGRDDGIVSAGRSRTRRDRHQRRDQQGDDHPVITRIDEGLRRGAGPDPGLRAASARRRCGSAVEPR